MGIFNHLIKTHFKRILTDTSLIEYPKHSIKQVLKWGG